MSEQTDPLRLLSLREAGAVLESAVLALAVARCAAAYLDCLDEFTDTAAGNLSDCCQERVHHLRTALDRWRGVQAVVEMDGRAR